jgi:hypothetical protein
MLLFRSPFDRLSGGKAAEDAMPTGRSKSKASAKVMAWYLSGGDQQCPHCGQWYMYELEYRCPDCDEPSCPHCKSRHADERFVCPGCVDEGASHG